MKLTIPFTVTVNSKVYFAGEADLPEKEAEAVQAFLSSVPADNTLPVTDAPLPSNKDEGEGEGEGDGKKKRRGRGASEDSGDEE